MKVDAHIDRIERLEKEIERLREDVAAAHVAIEALTQRLFRLEDFVG